MSDKHIVSGFDRDILAIETARSPDRCHAGDVLTGCNPSLPAARTRKSPCGCSPKIGRSIRLKHRPAWRRSSCWRLRAPSAVDLRFVLSVLEVCTHLERCRRLCERTSPSAAWPLGPHGHFTGHLTARCLRMSEAVNQMLTDCAGSPIWTAIPDKARAVIDADLDTDQRYISLFSRAPDLYDGRPAQHYRRNASAFRGQEPGTDFGDRATGIAEQVILSDHRRDARR